MAIQFVRSVINNSNIILHTKGESVSNFCYTTDVIRGLLVIITEGKNGEAYNVCNESETRKVKEIADLVAASVGKNLISVEYDIPEENSFGYAPDTVMRLSSEKLKALGWNATVSMADAYQYLVDYLRENI